MIVIYAEKASLAKAIASALHAGNRIAHPKEPAIGHYEFIFNGEKTIICHVIRPVLQLYFLLYYCYLIHAISSNQLQLKFVGVRCTSLKYIGVRWSTLE